MEKELIDPLIELQQTRNKCIAHYTTNTTITTPTVKYISNVDNPHLWHTTTAQHTVKRSAIADECVTLYKSPFIGRNSTIVFSPLDRPWDGDERNSKDTNIYVIPAPLPQMNNSNNNNNNNNMNSNSDRRCLVPRTGKYAELHFTMPAGAVRFSAVMCTLERAGFTEEKSLISTSWSLKWCKRPVRSDFIRLESFQRMNHFPGTWRIGKKDELHKHLVAARARWNERVCNNRNNVNSEEEEANGMIKVEFGNFFPDAWVLPEEQDELYRVMTSRQERGHVFIVKPTTSACGRGIYLIQGKEHLTLNVTLNSNDIINNHENTNNNNNNNNNNNMNSKKSWGVGRSIVRPGRVLVQRYVMDPLLIEGYKFDLRLYLVVTSFSPLRAYLYDEGLVRFATSPYPTGRNEETAIDLVGNESALTAHLTNFTINKKSEDYVPPCDKTHNNNNNNNNNEKEEEEGGEKTASKWTLTTLQKYFHTHQLDWEGTMTRIHDLLMKVLLAVEPHVIEELEALSSSGTSTNNNNNNNNNNINMISSSSLSTLSSSCFEVYGVDVLLRQPQAPLENIPIPVLMEVNIMPSLSTHYSLLDQCIKGNFIADMLTLVGITAMGKGKKRGKGPIPVSKLQEMNESVISYGHPFLDSLTDTNELEACMTSEEEFLRSTHFHRLCPTPESYVEYEVLFSERDVKKEKRSLNEVLSLWEQAKMNNPPSWV